MDNVEILKQVASLLAIKFQLKLGQNVYVTTHTVWREGTPTLAFQVSDGGSRFDSRAGSGRDETFNLNVAIWRFTRLDAAGTSIRALTTLADSVFALRQQVVTLLDNNYLGTLLVRPLLLVGESGVRDNPKYPGLLLKELVFVGGTIIALD